MTARLVTQIGRRDYREFITGSDARGGHTPSPGAVGGDRMLPSLWASSGRPPGQLWERLAERSSS